ncbi:MAG: 3-deoxy-D-manno-octulosonic acid kinase [Steroidobacteraceae bacterium]|nr:3-deoxy-D-manno-octulosonic acid kinase [Steroidobacteraceae bacterium]
MARTWTSGSEVKRVAVDGGAMLYDASRVGNLRAEWFDPAYWRKRDAVTGEAPGRGATVFFATNGHEYALRHYRRGGLIARLSSDRYLWRGEGAARPVAEWHLTYHLAHAGLPVAPPVAARYERHGIVYRGDLITERLAGTMSLAAALELGSVPILTWVDIGRCLRRFHDLGVCHADLNAHNILLGAGGMVHLIDFDRATLRRPGLWRDANLVRLRRSLDKVTDSLPPGRATEADWHSLLAGYREGPPANDAPPAAGSVSGAQAAD